MFFFYITVPNIYLFYIILVGKNQIARSNHPPYSPDSAPCDFCKYVNKVLMGSFLDFYCQIRHSGNVVGIACDPTLTVTDPVIFPAMCL